MVILDVLIARGGRAYVHGTWHTPFGYILVDKVHRHVRRVAALDAEGSDQAGVKSVTPTLLLFGYEPREAHS
jgi:hypothetical protein